MRVSVVVVSHNGGQELISAVRSVSSCSLPVEVVVVDNASTDGSPEAVASAFPQASVLRNARNLGFAAAANRGIRASSGELVLLLTQDAVLRPGALERLVATAAGHPRAAAVGPLVHNPDGSIQPSRRAFPTLWQSLLHGILGPWWPTNPGTRAYTLSSLPLDAPSRVGWVSGSVVLLRRRAVEEVGGFDERFFFFVEDVDLCRRLTDAGWEIWWEPRAEAVHAWGTSWAARPLRFLWMHHVNLFRYAVRHHRGAWVAAYPLIAAGLGVRFVMLAVRWIVSRRAVPPHRAQREEVSAR